MSVAIGYTHTGMVYQPFMQCLFSLMAHDAANHKRIGALFGVGHPYIPTARTLVVEAFLQTDCTHLLFLDYDMMFQEDALDRLYERAEGRAIVGALYFAHFVEGAIKPVWLERRNGNDNSVMHDVELERFYDLSTTGMGFTLIHREVFETLAKTHAEDSWPWFGHDLFDGTRMGEDVTFCARARAEGYGVYGDSSVQCGHIKRVDLNYDSFAEQREGTPAPIEQVPTTPGVTPNGT